MKKPFLSLLLLLVICISYSVYSQPILNSFPSAKATVYLDFNGYNVNSGVWNGGVPFTCAASTMSDVQITEAFFRVSEDYRPFNINVTTDSSVYLAAPAIQRIRVVITPTSSWCPGVSGVSFVGSFTWGDETPCFVFCDRLGPNNPKFVGECCSHESGHTMGLYHQSSFDESCNLITVYNEGTGTGEIGWAPIMGNSYNRNMTSWNNGPTPFGCGITQDNLSIITSQNGFTYRTDDFADDINTTPAILDPLNINIDGLIANTTDKDAFKFTITRSSSFHLDATPYNVGSGNNGANVDLRLQLFDGSKNLLSIYDPEKTMSVTLDTTLNTGTYYLLVDGAGNSNATDYNSIGSYNLRSITTVLPIRSVTLTGKTADKKHELNWNVISDEPVKYCIIESSTDGISFKDLFTVAVTLNSFSYTPAIKSNMFYRLKVTSMNDQIIYSNVIGLTGTEKTDNLFSISTFTHDFISINSTSDFQYRLLDMNGKLIVTGNGIAGYNNININSQPKGIYILQLLNNKEMQTERIIKQ